MTLRLAPTVRRGHKSRHKPCRFRFLCWRRHRWQAECPCGWARVYRRRWEAERALTVFHLEDDHGGADD